MSRQTYKKIFGQQYPNFTKAKTMITVTFDSNVWENIVDEEKRKTNTIFEKLYLAIKTGKIKPYFFEGAFTYEAIPRKNRKEYFEKAKAEITATVDESEFEKTGEIHLRLCIQSSKDAQVGLTDYLKKNAPKAFALGFKILKAPRIAGLCSKEIGQEYYADEEFHCLTARLDRYHECGRFIETLGAGKAVLDKTVLKDNAQSVSDAIKNSSPEILNSKIASNISEWSDGDALAAHYGYGIAYFCSYDQAGSAGTQSVFSKENRKILEEKFQIKIKNPNEIMSLL